MGIILQSVAVEIYEESCNEDKLRNCWSFEGYAGSLWGIQQGELAGIRPQEQRGAPTVSSFQDPG